MYYEWLLQTSDLKQCNGIFSWAFTNILTLSLMESKIEGRLILAATSWAQKIALKIEKNGIKCYEKLSSGWGFESSGRGLIIFFTSLLST